MDDLREHIHKLREDFSKGTLDEKDVSQAPSEQFDLWMRQAVEAQVREVQAMNLCTVSAEGRPSSRIVYLREFTEDSYCFYCNYNSRKATELENNPQAAITFFWPQLERQIRIEGKVTKAPASQSDNYFDQRPFESRVGAWASAQSSVIATREELEKNVEELKKKFTPETIRRPLFWGGLILTADYYEFWQGRKSRLHDRIAFNRTNSGWNISRLAP
jgi:pyridoxamine 5'-phosphate oxidase